jgi:regulator of RNase E activity RraA
MDQQPGFRILPRVESDAALLELFEGLPASNISDNMSRMPGTAGLNPYHRPGVQLRGLAFTVRVRSGDNLMIHRALQLARPGDVLVIDGEGCTDRALIGEIMKNVAQSRGIVGAVIDGAIRDVAAFRRDGFPCYARAVCHRGPYKDGPGEINVQVTVGGMIVNPGDLIIGDDDGVVAIPPKEARAVAEATRKKAAAEAATLDAIAKRKYDDAWIEKTLKAKGL